MRRRVLDPEEYISGILSGDRTVLGRAITLIESQLPEDRELAVEVLKACQGREKDSFRIGMTGVPGVGKSTFIDEFGMRLTRLGHKVAVLAVDPSSKVSGGSILGDKTRMERLSRDEFAFIRPSPSGLSLGGVTRTTREVIMLCEAAGFDRIIVETVGVGQSETAVASLVDFFLLLMLPGAGDELQGMKRGIMEMADAVLINKADGENVHAARKAAAGYNAALKLFPEKEFGWNTRVQTCSALEGSGIDAVISMLDEFQAGQKESGEFFVRRARQRVEGLKETLHYFIWELAEHDPRLERMLREAELNVSEGLVPPTVAAWELFRQFFTHKQD